MTDKELIRLLFEAAGKTKVKRQRDIGREIERLVHLPYEETDKAAAALLAKLKDRIDGIPYQCSLKHTQRILLAQALLKDFE